MVKSGQNFEGFRFSEPSTCFYHFSSNAKLTTFLYSPLTKPANDLISNMCACGCKETTQPSLQLSKFVFTRDLNSTKSCRRKFKFQRRAVFVFCFLIAYGFGDNTGKISLHPEIVFFPSRCWSSVVFQVVGLGGIPKWVFIIRKLRVWREFFRMKWGQRTIYVLELLVSWHHIPESYLVSQTGGS